MLSKVGWGVVARLGHRLCTGQDTAGPGMGGGVGTMLCHAQCGVVVCTLCGILLELAWVLVWAQCWVMMVGVL